MAGGYGSSFPPFENLDGVTQQPIGLDVDLANAIASRWGVKVEIVGVGFDELLDAVTAYRVDSAISALPVVEHRTREVAFSAPYVEAGVLLVAPRIMGSRNRVIWRESASRPSGAAQAMPRLGRCSVNWAAILPLCYANPLTMRCRPCWPAKRTRRRWMPSAWHCSLRGGIV